MKPKENQFESEMEVDPVDDMEFDEDYEDEDYEDEDYEEDDGDWEDPDIAQAQ